MIVICNFNASLVRFYKCNENDCKKLQKVLLKISSVMSSSKLNVSTGTKVQIIYERGNFINIPFERP